MSETVVLTISDLSRAGSGVARGEDGRVVFVPFSAPGDRVEAKIMRVEKRYAFAELVRVIEPSPSRVTPPCRIFGQCGGCQWQHIPYDLQWKTKSSGVAYALKRVGIECPSAVEEYPAAHPWEYRNRIQLRGTGRDLGFFEPRSRKLVPADRCEIARPEINAGWEETRAQAPRPDSPPGGAAAGPMFKVEIEVDEAGQLKRTWNSPHAALGFRQINDEQNARLRAWVAEVVSPGKPLLDLYGGSGNLSQGLASQMARIDCVDLSCPGVRPAGTAENFFFHRAPVLPWLRQQEKNPNQIQGRRSLIADPPREGLGETGPETISEALLLGTDEWIAIGCDPDSWARDLSRLVKRGFKLQRVAAFDLFPQTPHVEAAAILRLV